MKIYACANDERKSCLSQTFMLSGQAMNIVTHMEPISMTQIHNEYFKLN